MDELGIESEDLVELFKGLEDVEEDSNKINIEVDESTKRWITNNNEFWAAYQTSKIIPAGVYECNRDNARGPFLSNIPFESDDIIELPDPKYSTVLREFDKFWTLKEEFKERGFLHKRGFMLLGSPGTGKTALVNLLTTRMIKNNGLVLMISYPNDGGKCLHTVRKIEPDRPLMVTLEDFDALIKRYGEEDFLALLDGETQINNVVIVATSNYPEDVDKRFLNRPSRFDTVVTIDMPCREARESYLRHKEPDMKEDYLQLWVDKTEGFSVAHIKELILSVRCFGQTLEEALDRLRHMKEDKLSSSKFQESGCGFIIHKEKGIK
jgi:SpoVK/Ycf46/Vps4 family AAA+-type ATPase